MRTQQFETIGHETIKIPVRLSYRIIELFSDGLYSSPNKAIEELVSNSFDAGAGSVHVVLSPDRTTEDAVIIVADDGEGMDEEGLKRHWLIGESNKRELTKPPKGRKQIGKFGIGKLATFVLSNHLTHICKIKGKFYAVTMDYSKVPSGKDGGIYTEEIIKLPLRELTLKEAKEAIGNFLDGNKEGYKAIQLFGPGAAKSWTVAIMSNLKPMAQEIQKGRLGWVLRTAMPLRDDFKLYLDGDELRPSKESIPPVKKWVIGKDLKKLSKPAPGDELEPTEDPNALPIHRYGLTHPALGRITGYVEVYERSLTEGKSDMISRSNGFFVYARGRLINTDDELFGLTALRHGTFARFRAVVHIDKLDEDLRSTRENVRDSSEVKVARDILNAIFNHARNWLVQYDEDEENELRATGKIARSAGSLTRRPILGLINAAFSNKADPRFIILPKFSSAAERESFLESLQQRAETEAGLVSEIRLEELDRGQGIAVLEIASGTLQLNTLHPFVAAHLEDYEAGKDTLSLFAMAEVLTEAYLYELGLDKNQVIEVMDRRDELLRQFARSMRRTADMVAQALIDAATDKNKLEQEIVAAFDSMGFDALRIGGSGKPDGKAVAHLGMERRYAVSLEAKSKEKPSATVSAKATGVSGVARQRDAFECDHAVVIGPDFPTGRKGEESALVLEARSDHAHTNKTITFIKVADLSKLVRLVTLKGVGLDRLRHFFRTCITPEESAAWINNLASERAASAPPFELVLRTIWQLQDEIPNEAVQFQSITTMLRRDGNSTKMTTEEIIQLCRAIAMLTPWVVVREQSIELTQRPDKVIASARAVFGNFPEEEQKRSIFNML